MSTPAPSAFWHHVASFIGLGVTFATLMSRQPALQAEYGLNAGDWGWCLLAAGAGGVSAYPITRWMLLHKGSRTLLTCNGILLGLGLVLLPWWPGGLASLLLALFCQGLLMNGLNVAVNSQAVHFENRTGRFCMGRLHALFYLGVTGAAFVSSAAVAAGLSAHQHFAVVGLGVAGSYLWLSRRFAVDIVAPHGPTESGSYRPSRAVLAFGTLGALASIVASGIDGWTPLLLHNVMGTSASTASLGLGTFSLSMFIGRMLTDSLAHRFGPRRARHRPGDRGPGPGRGVPDPLLGRGAPGRPHHRGHGEHRVGGWPHRPGAAGAHCRTRLASGGGRGPHRRDAAGRLARPGAAAAGGAACGSAGWNLIYRCVNTGLRLATKASMPSF
jgi:hypothetical protein